MKFVSKVCWGILALGFFAALWAGPVSTHGQLRVQGNRIVNGSGQEVQLAGMSFFWSQWIGKYWNRQVVDWLVSDWNTTIVRAAMGIESNPEDPGYLADPVANTNKVKTIVDAAIANDIYVIIDWHDHNAQDHVSQAKAFFSEMARTYGNRPNIIYEIYNEPLDISWNTIKNYANEVIASIRQHDANNIIVVGTPNWSQDVDVAANSPISGSNIAYTFHFYSSDQWHQEGLRNKANSAMSRGVAIMATEWGASEASGDGQFNRSTTDTWMNWMDQNKITWCNWSVADKSETSAALRPGASSTGNWSTGDLSESGQYIRNKLRSYPRYSSGGTSSSGGISSSGGTSSGGTSSSSQNPGTRVTLPGRIQAESYTSMSGVELETTSDAGGGQNIGYIDNGDWTQYAIAVPTAGSYTVSVRVATETAGGTIALRVGNTQVGSVDVSTTGGWQSWTTVQTTVNLPAGNQDLRLTFQGSAAGLFNINWIDIQSSVPTALFASLPAWSPRPEVFLTESGLSLRLGSGHPYSRATLHSANGRELDRMALTAEQPGLWSLRDDARSQGVRFLRLHGPQGVDVIPLTRLAR